MFISKSIVFLCLLAGLSACSKNKASPVPPPIIATTAPAVSASVPVAEVPVPLTEDQKLYEQLMLVIFAQSYRSESGDALAELPDVDHRDVNTSYVVRAIGHKVLSTGEMVLVANAEHANEDGEASSGHVSSGVLNVFIFKETEGKWELLKSHLTVASLGSSGQIGDFVWTDLAKGKPGLAVLHGGTWQGYSILTLSLFDLTADTLYDLTGESINIHSDSDGGCNPEDGKCWNITGDWQFSAAKPDALYDDIVVKFSGYKSKPQAVGRKPPPEGVKQSITKVKNSARYSYDGKRYQLIEGENKVPGI